MADGGRVEVRRAEDGELLGFIAPVHADRWVAESVFGGVLGVRDTVEGARSLVESDGLASLARRWFYRASPADDWEVVVIQEAWPGRAVVVLGPYALAGMPTVEVTTADLAGGIELTLQPPDDDLAQFAS